MNEHLRLFCSFFRIGGLTFGGGYAMLPMLQRELVQKNGWVSQEEILNYFAIGQCTPGIIAVNTATFVGYKRRGVAGAFTATLGLVMPSLIIILILAAFLQNFAQEPAVKQAFAGIRAAVSMLIVTAVLKLYKSSLPNGGAWIVFLLCVGTGLAFSFSPVFTVAGGAAAGLLFFRGAR